MCNVTRCPIEGKFCADCLNSEEPCDGPDPEMLKPSERDHSDVLRAGTFGL